MTSAADTTRVLTAGEGRKAVTAVAFNEAGTLCASGGDDCEVNVRDVNSGQVLWSCSLDYYVRCLGFVATVCPDGTPNLSPKGTTAVWDDDHLVFANIRSPGTLANLRQNANVELNVVDPFARRP